MTGNAQSGDALADALVRAGEALRQTAARLSRVEMAVGEVLMQSGDAGASHFADLQQLDLSTQEVSALAEFIDRLGRRTPHEVTIDLASAAQPIPLHDLATFLGRRPSPLESQAEDDIFF
jgi:hypothetical protein